MNPELVPASGTEAGHWDDIVAGSPHGTIFHRWDWQKIVEKHTGMTFHPLILMDRETPAGVLPLFSRGMVLFRMALSPPPGTALNFLGPVLAGYEDREQEKREQLLDGFLKALDRFLLERLDPGYVSLALPPGLADPRPFIWAGYQVESRYDYIVDLGEGADALWGRIDRKLRQNISRAEKRGMTAGEGGGKDLAILHGLMVERYREQGRRVSVPLRYLADLYDRFGDSMKVFVVRNREGEVVTGMIDVYSKDRVFSWIGNPRPTPPLTPSPNDLLTWEGIRFAAGHGFARYITVGAAGNERLHSYYASKFDPALGVRYTVKRSTLLARFLEMSYRRFGTPGTGLPGSR